MDKVKQRSTRQKIPRVWRQGERDTIDAFLNLTAEKHPPGLPVGKHVLSVQYKELSSESSANKLMYHYFSWIDRVMKRIIRVYNTEDEAAFFLFGRIRLLHFKKEFGSDKLCCWIIRGGLLNKERHTAQPRGRFWIVTAENSAGEPGVYTALSDFQPALPWLLYVPTQGAVHPYVMKRFLSQQ